jgi:hypothetical protein
MHLIVNRVEWMRQPRESSLIARVELAGSTLEDSESLLGHVPPKWIDNVADVQPVEPVE